ncbi:MAG: hypothetical protein MJ033_06740 [Victivallaceae bacterium]|nr:hypothetical protein [Victivallaceae bacterium]
MRRHLKATALWLYRFPVLPETAVLIAVAAVPGLIWCDCLPYPFRWQAEKILSGSVWCSAAGILWCIVCGILRWRQRERERGIALLLFAFAAALLTAGSVALYHLYSYFGPAYDHFADRLHLPENTVLQTPAMPEKAFDFRKAAPATFQAKVLNTFPAIFPEEESEFLLPSLEKLQQTDPENRRLLEYLAIHPGWRLYRESIGGNYIANRRFFDASGKYLSTRDGSYRFAGEGIFYRYRLNLRLSGRSWNNRLLRSGGEYDADAVYHRYATRVMAGKICAEILEENTVPGRIMTAQTVFELESEFSSLLAGHAEFPENAVTSGTPELALSGCHGDYAATIFCNPGEAGDLYLKAFEITGNTPLSADHLRRTATERTGYSADPGELFFAQIPFRIYEGDWGQFYGVRLEVWFSPEDKSSPDRKLLEKNFKIEGWMREN